MRLHPKINNGRIYISKEQLPMDRIISMRLENTSNEAQEVKLTTFNIGIPENAFDTDTRCLQDGDIATPYFCSKAALDVALQVPEDTKEVILVGNANCKVTGATPSSIGEHVRRYKVDKGTRNIRITHPKQDHRFLNEVIFK